jgi:hypothetical protein
MGCPNLRGGLANLRTGNPTLHLGYPRPNKSGRPGPHREPIRRNIRPVPTGSVPTGAGANRYPDYWARSASANDARPRLERSRPPHPFRPILSSVLVGRHVPRSAPPEQAPLPAPFRERACLRLSASELRRGRERFSVDLLSDPPSDYRRSTCNWGNANAGCPPWRRQLESSADASNLPHPLGCSLNVSGSVGTMGGGAAVIAVAWGRWCGGCPGYGAQASADCRTDASTTPTAGDRTDDSPGAGADQAAAERALTGIVWVRGSRRRQQQSGADHAGYSRLPSHSLPTTRCREAGPPGMPTFG